MTIETEADRQNNSRPESKSEPSAESVKTASGVFKAHSTTHSGAALFLPHEIRLKTTAAYAFFRVVDDIVDEADSSRRAGVSSETLLGSVSRAFFEVLNGGKLKDSEIAELIAKLPELQLVVDFAEVLAADKFPTALAEKEFGAFFQSMRWDLEGRKYESWEELEEYMYGAASSVGMILGEFLKLDLGDSRIRRSIENMGYAVQLVNITRDVGEDKQMGRIYIPEEVLRSNKTVGNLTNSEYFEVIVRLTTKYKKYKGVALTGLKYLPARPLVRNPRVAIATLIDVYDWTMEQIIADPTAAYEQQVKPSRFRVMAYGLKNAIVRAL